MSDRNGFRDVQKEIDNQQGVFANSGAWAAQEKIDEKISDTTDQRGAPVGFDFSLLCIHCGKPVCVTLPWIELITASARVVPADADTGEAWVLKGGFLYPPITCSCGNPIHIPITPDKAERMVKTAISMQILPPQAVQQMQQRAVQMSQQGRR